MKLPPGPTLALTLLFGACGFSPRHAASVTAHNEAQTAPRSIRFGDGATDVADLWLPDGGPFPVVLMIHGGCWRKSVADRSIMDDAAQAIRQHGYAVWNIEYRGVDEVGGGYPGTFQDVARAADALSGIAAHYNLRTDRVIAFGHSAGGHLALWLAARGRLPRGNVLHSDDPLRLSGVLNVAGLGDLQASAALAPESCVASVLPNLTGARSAVRPNVFADTSPAEMLPLGVRQISISGEVDGISPPALGREFDERSRAAGDQSGFLLIPGADHLDTITPGTAAFAAELTALDELAR